MKILYIFPHPDDESYGPCRAMTRQIREGHQVYLLTLTRGGATKERHKFDYSIDEMGQVRSEEYFLAVGALGLNGATIFDFPDGGLNEEDPRKIEAVIREEIEQLQPDIVVTYAVHGISGHPDHQVCHAVVKRVYNELRDDENSSPKRLAFYTVPERTNRPKNARKHSNFSKGEEIDCIVEAEEEDREKFLAALDCYETYRERIEKSGIRKSKNKNVYFEIYQEAFDPPLGDLTAKIF